MLLGSVPSTLKLAKYFIYYLSDVAYNQNIRKPMKSKT